MCRFKVAVIAFLVTAISIAPVFASSDTPAQEDETAISKFAAIFHPLGFLQFGPIIGIQIGLKDDLAVEAHVRLASLGLVSQLVREHDDGLDEFSAIAFGGGPVYFFGRAQNKPYLGLLLEYETAKMLYGKDEKYEWWETHSTVAFFSNFGYRFRFEGGLFINTGLSVGAARTKWEFDFSDPAFVPSKEKTKTGSITTPFGFIEVSAGIEF